MSEYLTVFEYIQVFHILVIYSILIYLFSFIKRTKKEIDYECELNHLIDEIDRIIHNDDCYAIVKIHDSDFYVWEALNGCILSKLAESNEYNMKQMLDNIGVMFGMKDYGDVIVIYFTYTLKSVFSRNKKIDVIHGLIPKDPDLVRQMIRIINFKHVNVFKEDETHYDL